MFTKISFLLPVLFCFTIVHAQSKNRKWDIRVAASGGTHAFLQEGGQFLTINLFGAEITESAYTAEILYQTSNRKIKIGLAASHTNVRQYYVSIFDFGGGSDHDHLVAKRKVIAFMPSFNYSYIIRKNSILYSEACVGIAVSNHDFYDTKTTEHSISPAFQGTLLGYRIGRRIGIFAELGYGYKGILQFGVSGTF